MINLNLIDSDNNLSCYESNRHFMLFRDDAKVGASHDSPFVQAFAELRHRLSDNHPLVAFTAATAFPDGGLTSYAVIPHAHSGINDSVMLGVINSVIIDIIDELSDSDSEFDHAKASVLSHTYVLEVDSEQPERPDGDFTDREFELMDDEAYAERMNRLAFVRTLDHDRIDFVRFPASEAVDVYQYFSVIAEEEATLNATAGNTWSHPTLLQSHAVYNDDGSVFATISKDQVKAGDEVEYSCTFEASGETVTVSG